ncbi:hypothetical protein Tco_0673849, partial [Tanacetum coccineum]
SCGGKDQGRHPTPSTRAPPAAEVLKEIQLRDLSGLE